MAYIVKIFFRLEKAVIKGLYVAGEASGGVHGRNRLIGNSVLDYSAFGRRAGKFAAEYVKTATTGKLSLAHLQAYEDEFLKDARLQSLLPRQAVPAFLVGRELPSPDLAERILSWRHTGFSVRSKARAKSKPEAERVLLLEFIARVTSLRGGRRRFRAELEGRTCDAKKQIPIKPPGSQSEDRDSGGFDIPFRLI